MGGVAKSVGVAGLTNAVTAPFSLAAGAMGIGGMGDVVGGLTGFSPDVSTSSSSVNLPPADYTELNANFGLTKDYNSLRSMVDKGPGETDISSAVGSSRDLASLLDNYAKNGVMPTESDLTNARQSASTLFDPQRTAMQQSFADQTTQANRLAQSLGRSIDDPIIQAKLRTNMMNQQALLSSNQNAFAFQQAQAAPLQRLGFAQQRADLLGGLAAQAMQNRQALLQTGMSIRDSDRNFRLQAATRNTTNTSGGGWAGVRDTALAVGGTAASIMGGFGAGGAGGGFGMSGGGGGSKPSGGGGTTVVVQGGGGGGMSAPAAPSSFAAAPMGSSNTFTNYGPNPAPSYLSSQSNMSYNDLLSHFGVR